MRKYLLYITPIILIGGEIDQKIIKAQEPVFLLINEDNNSLYFSAPLLDCRDNCKETNQFNIYINYNFIREIEQNISKVIFKDYIHEIKNSGTILSSSKNNEIIALFKKSFPEKVTLKSSFLNKETLENLVYKRGYLLDIKIKNIKVEFRAINSRKDSGFNVEPLIDLTLQGDIYEFNSSKNSYELAFSLEGISQNISETANIKALYSLNMFDSKYKNSPNVTEATQEIKNIFAEVYKNSLINLLQNIDKEDKFKVFIPISNIINGEVKFKKLAKYGEVRIASPLIFESNDEISAIGFVENISDEISGKVIKYSKKDALNFDNVKIAYWEGYLFSIYTGYGMSEITHNDSKVAGITNRVISGGIVSNLGYIFNSRLFKDIWLRASATIGDQTADVNQYKNFSSVNFSYLYGYEFELEYRYYPKIISKFLGGFYLDGDLNIMGLFGDYDVKYYNQNKNLKSYGDGQLSISSHSIGLAFGIGSTVSHNFGWFWKIGYDMPIYQQSSLEHSGREISLDYLSTSEFGYGGIFRTFVGIDFNW